MIGLAPALHHAMLLECQAGDALAAVQWSNQMDFELSGSQKEIRAAVTALCARFGNEYWHRCDEKSSYPEEFVKTLSEAGWQR